MHVPHANFQSEIGPARLKSPALDFLRDYWEKRRAGRAMPARADMNPTAFKAHLDCTAMIDVLDGGAEFRYRLVGTALTSYFLSDPTGLTLSAAWPGAADPVAVRVRANLLRIVQLRAPIHVWGMLEWSSARHEPFDALYLPLSDDGENVNMILNLFTFDRARVLLDRQLARERGETTLIGMDDLPIGAA